MRDSGRWAVAGLITVLLACGSVWWFVPSSAPTPRCEGGSPTAAPSDLPSTGAMPEAPASTGGAASPAPPVPSATGRRCVDTSTSRTLRVLTFNIHSGFATGHRGLRLDLIAAEIRASKADVVLLQETDDGRARTNRVDQPAVLARATGTAYAFAANVVGPQNSRYGTTVLSRFPIVSSANTYLPRPGATQQRGLLHVVIQVGEQRMSIYDTHLENTSKVARLQQIRRIVPVLRADPLPFIIGGDFNSGPLSPVLATARTAAADTWAAVGVGPGFTHPQHGPRVRIDYLLYRSGSGAQLAPIAAQVRRSTVSDHRMVSAAYRLTGAGDPVCLPLLDLGGRRGR